MVTILKVTITFDEQEKVYETGKELVKRIKIDEKKRLIEIFYENESNIKYMLIPIDLLDSYYYE